MKTRLFAFLLALIVPALLLAQEFRGTISGAVADPDGAGIAGVHITATESRTGTKTQTQTNSDGQYTLPFLLPGDYTIAAETTGFKTFLRQGIHLDSGGHPVVDIKLVIGSITESVKVVEEVPLLNVENASTSQVITAKQVEDLPLNGRAPMMLAQLAIGVVATSNPSLVHPFDNNGSAAWSISGTPAQTSELLMDGAPDELWSGSLAYSPSQDAVQEVTVDAFNTDAAYGHTYAGTINMVLKTGTNDFHGSLYEFGQASALDANNWFNDAKGSPKPITHFNQYGLTAGGPVIIPKLYNGKDKLFWFFAWENLDDAQPTADITTVPTTAEGQGDLTTLMGSSQLYNPYSGVLSGGTITRQPFQCDPSGNPLPPNLTPGPGFGTQAAGTPCNKIPTALLNPVAQAYLKFYPSPNATGTADGFDNYLNQNTSADTFDNELGRLDYNMSSRSHLFFDFRHNARVQEKNNYFSNISTGTTLARVNWGATLDEVYTFSPTLVANVRANWTHMNEVHGDPSTGFDPSKLGFPSYIASSSQYLILPAIAFSGSCGSQASFQCLGNTSDGIDPSDAYQLFADIVKSKGKHTLKFGIDFRRYQFGYTTFGTSSPTGSTTGAYTFGSNWTNGPTTSAAAPAFGPDFASFLLGLPTSGTYNENAAGFYRSYYYSAYVQDDWRVTRTLSLNLGLRFEHDTPYGESLGETVNGFNFSAASPVQSAAQAAFANDFPAGLPTDNGQAALTQFNVLGGLTFASPGNPAVYKLDSHMFSPRVGFAWSPDSLHAKTVIRGGFGIFVAPFAPSALGTNGNYSSNPLSNQEGFSANTTYIATSNNFLSPATTLGNPFPNGIEQPVGSSEGLGTFLGQTVSFISPNEKDTYSLRWNLGVQEAITPNLLFEVDYVGNHGVHLPIEDTQDNPIPAQYLSTQATRDTTVISALSATVANPFKGLLPGTSLNGSTISVAQLLSIYPEFPQGNASTSAGVLNQNAPNGQSFFDSLDVRLEKRFSKGLSVIANYSFSRLIEKDSYLNVTDTHLEERISPFDHTHHFVAGFNYDLPIGRGRALNLESRWANLAFGGWTVNGIYTYQTGAPILWSNSDYVYLGGPLDYNASQVNGPTFNTAAFDTKASDQFQYHIRTWPSTLSSVRYEGINNLDSSILKNFGITERVYFQLRLEAFNVLNHPTFGGISGSAGPNMTPTSSAFGTLAGQANLPRQIQLGARFVW
ncbi:MAG: carboxypeptidase regulatory-like domain-containing protein [Candidatus Acidiferrum sp.]